jgi:hypothetical protein
MKTTAGDGCHGEVVAVSATAALLTVLPATTAAAAWSSIGAGPGGGRALVMASVTGVTASCASTTWATLSWTGVGIATSYPVERSSNPLSRITVTSTAGTTALDSGLNLLPGLNLRWRVTAHRNNWNAAPSAASNQVTITALGICI